MAPATTLARGRPPVWEPGFVDRPWLSLYGIKVRPIAPPGSLSGKPPEDSALLHRMLPDELLLAVFQHMSPINLGRAACVCRKWWYTIRTPSIWQTACLSALQDCSEEDQEKLLKRTYWSSWRRMWILRPRLRVDGIYVSRNTYIRCGIVEWNTKNPVHMVCYFRYLRFLPNGKAFYKVTPQFLKEVAKSMAGRVSTAKADGVLVGRWTLTDSLMEAAVLYPGLRPTVLRIRGRLRGTCEGAYNRLDLLSLVTSGIHESEIPGDTEDVLQAVEGWDENESHNPDVPAVSHRRGMAPFVFVPFDDVETDILNLPVDKMDYYCPG